jgi:hypothetical protein
MRLPIRPRTTGVDRTNAAKGTEFRPFDAALGHGSRVLPPRHDGQNTFGYPEMARDVQPSPQKYSPLRKSEHRRITMPIPRPLPRAYRDRHDTWCGLRWTRAARQANAARADGKGVWSWSPDAGIKLIEMIDGRRRQKSPVSGESAL